MGSNMAAEEKAQMPEATRSIDAFLGDRLPEVGFELLCFEAFLNACLASTTRAASDLQEVSRSLLRRAPRRLVTAVIQAYSPGSDEDPAEGFCRLAEDRIREYLVASKRDLGSEAELLGERLESALRAHGLGPLTVDYGSIAERMLENLQAQGVARAKSTKTL